MSTPPRARLASHMQRDCNTDLAEPYEARPSMLRLVGLQRPTRREAEDTLSIPGETVLELRDKLSDTVFAIPPSHVWYLYEQLTVWS
jgi:hypothetical protein